METKDGWRIAAVLCLVGAFAFILTGCATKDKNAMENTAYDVPRRAPNLDGKVSSGRATEQKKAASDKNHPGRVVQPQLAAETAPPQQPLPAPAKMTAPTVSAPAPSVSLDAIRSSADGSALSAPSVYQAYVEGKLSTPVNSVPAVSAPGTESYKNYTENEFQTVANQPLSTFSIDVDTASYTNIRRFLSQGLIPPQDAVRIEEMINYFNYDYPQPEGNSPFAVNVETADCPWAPEHLVARIGIKGRVVTPKEERPGSNIVFLLDTSGSMGQADKLPLFVKAMKLLVDSLDKRDRVGIVTYSDVARVALRSSHCHEKGEIKRVLDSLCANGCTNGAGGIQMAYDMARDNLVSGGTNRVILCTDGDFNVGVTQTSELTDLIQKESKSGVFFTVLGYGTGNLKDTNLQALADKGNGQYCYIDSFKEARRVLMDQVTGTLITIAKDVKIQVEFNPAKVTGYRLIGYEKRALAAKDFNDDRKDAGEIGSGHTVTALYEIVPNGQAMPAPSVDPLKYQPKEPAPAPATTGSKELMTVKLRYKMPDSDTSTKFDFPVVATAEKAMSPDLKFASSVAAFGMILKNSAFKEGANLELVGELAKDGKGEDSEGARAEFIDLVKTAKALVK